MQTQQPVFCAKKKNALAPGLSIMSLSFYQKAFIYMQVLRLSFCSLIICMDNQISILTWLSEKGYAYETLASNVYKKKKRGGKDSLPNVGHLDLNILCREPKHQNKSHLTLR